MLWQKSEHIGGGHRHGHETQGDGGPAAMHPAEGQRDIIQGDPQLYYDHSRSALLQGTGIEDWFNYAHGCGPVGCFRQASGGLGHCESFSSHLPLALMVASNHPLSVCAGGSSKSPATSPMLSAECLPRYPTSSLEREGLILPVVVQPGNEVMNFWPCSRGRAWLVRPPTIPQMLAQPV